MGYDWDFSVLWAYRYAFLRGVWVTIAISVLSSAFGTIGGVALGVMYRFIPFKSIVLVFNDIFRAIPLLVLLFFFYYFPYKQLLGISPPDSLVCSILAMTVAQAAFTADLVRAAIEAVPKKSILGARSLGLTEPDVWRYIFLPDVVRQTLPAIIAFFIGIVKLSSLASVIGAEEVVFVARQAIAQRFRALEAWILVAVIYVVLIVPMTIFSRWFEGTEWLKRRG